MPTRDLGTNSKKVYANAQNIIDFTSDELIDSYKLALKEITEELDKLFKKFLTLEEPTRAELTQFMRKSNIQREIVNIMRPFLSENEAFIKDMTALGLDTGYFQTGWALDQAAGLSLGWGMVDDKAVRAAASLGGDLGDLAELLTKAEVKQHKKLVTKAFRNYDKDTVKWISRDIRQGIIKGESAVQVAKRLQKKGLAQSFNSAMRISRTEILRSTGIGNQIAYREAEEAGVQLNEVWDAVLDDRVRPDHAQADGTVRDKETGLFSVPWGEVIGPRRSGIPSEDINCRCIVVGEVEGYSPELKRIRDEGLQPYQTFPAWAQANDIKVNRFGQKYNF
jgi:hypothetical protein